MLFCNLSGLWNMLCDARICPRFGIVDIGNQKKQNCFAFSDKLYYLCAKKDKL